MGKDNVIQGEPIRLTVASLIKSGGQHNLDDLDRLFDTVRREEGKIDVLYASAGMGEALPLGEITEQHFDAAFNLNARAS